MLRARPVMRRAQRCFGRLISRMQANNGSEAQNEHQPGLEESRTAPVDFYPVPPSSSDMFSFTPSDSPAGDASLGASSSILAPESFLRSNVEPAAASAVRTEPRYCGLPITPNIFPPKNEPEWDPSTRLPAPSQGPAAFMLNMDMVQAKAEALEQQARRDIEDTQQLADRHSKEMLETRSFRVTQACEHCRYRKAKGKLCTFSKQLHRERAPPLHAQFDVLSQGSRPPPNMLARPTKVGPTRDKFRLARTLYDATPYGVRSESGYGSAGASMPREIMSAPPSSSGAPSYLDDLAPGSYSLPQSPITMQQRTLTPQPMIPFGAGMLPPVSSEVPRDEQQLGAFYPVPEPDTMPQAGRTWSSASFNMHSEDNAAVAYSTASTPSAPPTRSVRAESSLLVRPPLFSPGMMWTEVQSTPQSTPANFALQPAYGPPSSSGTSWDSHITHTSF
ncbi:hypothetical protein PaG_01426 [Moesziomyces aphidis]|uniref:Uncharacterized protein n=1 Tax=Moesziomyces aphidis TaxID=84754 RepID=W3VRB4_MOEAP|nr:hypothetical protein PaG_01426 [Moesziomyces aphidis]